MEIANKNQLLDCLRQLNDELRAVNAHAEILLAGGASMCLAHESRDMTKDIDALHAPRQLMDDLIRKIALRNGLDDKWINDSVKEFAVPDSPVEFFMNLGNLTLCAVSPHYLLSMKLSASRYGVKDRDGIKSLLKKLGVTTMDQAVGALSLFFPIDQIAPETRRALEEALDEVKGEMEAHDPARPGL